MNRDTMLLLRLRRHRCSNALGDVYASTSYRKTQIMLKSTVGRKPKKKIYHREHELDRVMELQKKPSLVLHLKSIIQSQKTGSLRLRDLEKEVGFVQKWNYMAAIEKYPCIFRVNGGQFEKLPPAVTLTEKAQKIASLEPEATMEMEPILVRNLRKLLMLSVDCRLPLDTIKLIGSELGLPSDFKNSLILKYPHFFKVNEVNDIEYLHLENWDSSLAVTARETKLASSEEIPAPNQRLIRGKISKDGNYSGPFAFRLNFPAGFRPNVSYLEEVRRWQRMDFPSPYLNARIIEAKDPKSRKRLVAVIHELLSLTMEKRLSSAQIDAFHAEYRLPSRLLLCLIKHHGIFYLTNKGAKSTVILKEAYGGSFLLEKCPLLLFRDKFLALMGRNEACSSLPAPGASLSSHEQEKPSMTITNWPVLGMLPGVLKNISRLNDYVTEILLDNGGTFEFKGGWFSNMDMVFTCDPSDIQYIFSKNFKNYPKGPEFKEKFEVLGDGIFNADFELWELHRRTTVQFMSNPRFYSVLEKSVQEKVESHLFQALDSFSDRRVEFDLQDIVQRFTFDNVCKLVLDYDPMSLRADLPYVASEKAFNDLIHGLLHRHTLPESIWKLKRRLKIGKEKKMIEAWKALDDMIYPLVVAYRENPNWKDYVLLGFFERAYEEYKIIVSGNKSDLKKFLRDTSLNLIFAGRDTTSSALSWLFWLVSKNPSVERKIVQEIESLLHSTNEGNNKNWRSFTVEDTKKLVYLQAVICETLRLFPSLPLEHKSPVGPDVLPSGVSVKENTKVVVSFYSTGRMRSLWGEDCLEFKPERWISGSDGSVKREPSYKFPAFNVGPRTCIGKEMAFIQIKMVASAVIYRYKIEAVEGGKKKYEVVPKDSVLLQMKHGLVVTMSRK